jgi:hypothetical protein
MTEESEPKLPSDFLEYVKTRHTDLSKLSPRDIAKHIMDCYLKPNWPHWRNMAEVSVQRALWLSLNVEPWKETSDLNKAIQGVSGRVPPEVLQKYRVYLGLALREDYEPRMAQCLAAIKAKALPAHWRDTSDPGLAHDLTLRWYVSLEQFRNWGESLRHPYPFPAEFPRAAAAEPKKSTVESGALAPLTGYSDRSVLRSLGHAAVATPPISEGREAQQAKLRAIREVWSPTTPVDQQVTPRPPSRTPVELPTSEASDSGGTTSVDDDEPDTKTRGTYLRTIRALSVMAKLIDDNGQLATGAAGRVAHRLQTLGFNNGPKERRIRDVLNEAASLKPGE